MEFEQAAIALLASMVLVLAGMVGWLYWQQTRLFQNMNNIVMVVGELASSRVPYPEPEPAAEEVLEEAPEEEEDDRVSVDSPAAVLIEGPPAVDTDGLEDKTKKELHDILTKRGIPFSKSDNKNALISLLKATS
jgi:hypothetical protein